MAYIKFLLVLLFFLFSHVLWDAAYEVARPKGVEALAQSPTAALASRIELTAAATFKDADFRSLEVQLTKAAAPDALLPDGTPRLTHVYLGLDQVFDSDMPWPAQESLCRKWLAIYPRSPGAHIALARLYYRHALQLSDDTYARSASADTPESFRDLLDKARISLKDSQSFATTDPVWFMTLIDIIGRQEGNSPALTLALQMAAAQHPDYLDIYLRAFNYLQPKWNGTADALEKMADWAATTASPNLGDMLYARLYASLTNEGNPYRYNMFISTHASWPRIRNGFEQLIAKWPDLVNHNTYALMACTYGDRVAAARELQASGDQPLDEVWHRPTARFIRCKSWAGIEQAEALNIPIPGNPDGYNYTLQTTARFFLRHDYLALENRYDDYVKNNRRYADGSSKLDTYYEALETVTTSNMIGGDDYWTGLHTEADKWQAAFPGSYLPRLMQASIYYNQAYLLIGQEKDHPQAITDEAHQRSEQLVAQALETLQQVKGQAGRNAWWIAQMTRIAAIQNWPQERIASEISSPQKEARPLATEPPLP